MLPKAGMQKDVLVPFFSHFYGGIIDVPWEEKLPKALMRAAAQVGVVIRSSRCTGGCPARAWQQLFHTAQGGTTRMHQTWRLLFVHRPRRHH